jgi:hypothetical protein
MSAVEKNLVGRTVCGEGKFETTKFGLRCRTCPDFTGDSGSDEGLQLGSMLRGRFTSSGVDGEWLLDTDGCEAHYDSFGGALLLGWAGPEGLGLHALAQGFSLATKSTGGQLTVIYYKPGFRLNDCLAFVDEDSRTLLVCNEADMAQGEVIGHISVMDVLRRGINRWRLLRWYDNTGSDMPHIVSVVPTGMRRLDLDDGQSGLQIKLEVQEAIRQGHDKVINTSRETISLIYRRKGRRFFATEKTQGHLERIGALVKKMLD